MSKFADFFKSKRRVIVLTVSIVLIAVVITATVMLTARDGGMRVKAIGGPAGSEISHEKVSDYQKSRLYLTANGTFYVKVIYKSQTKFIGMGLYEKVGGEYKFTYVDMFRVVGGTTQRDPYRADWAMTYKIKKGRIELATPTFYYYYFQ